MYVAEVYLAHSAVALATKRVDTRLPLSWCLLAAWAYDLTGVGHWAPVGVVLAIAAFLVGRRRWDTTAGLALGASVLSHDVVDLVVGVQVFPGARFVGLGLDADSTLELCLELAGIAIGWSLYWTTVPTATRRTPLLLIPPAAMAAFTVARWRVFKEEPDALALAVGVIGLVTTWVALVLVDRRVRKPVPASGASSEP